MLEMLVFIIGVYSFVFGSLRLPWKLDLHGWRARVASLFLIAPFPLTIFLARVIGKGLPSEQGPSVFGLSELVLVALGIGAAIVFSILTRPKEKLVDESSAENR